MVIRKLFKIKYALLAALIGILFIIYMAYDFHNSYSTDVVGGWKRIFILVNFIFHLPFLALIFMTVILYFNKKNMISSLVLGVGSLIYIILHILVPYFLQVKFSLYYITIFPLLGVVISIISIFECKIYDKNAYSKQR